MDDAVARARLTELWLAYQPTVAAFLRRRLPPSEVDDAISETFMVCWQKIDTVPKHERPWLLTIARNVAGTRMRTNERWQSQQNQYLTEFSSVSAADEIAVNRIRLQQAWAQLSDIDREILALVAWDNLPQNEAAQILGLTRSAYSVRLTRARKRLADLLVESKPLPKLTRQLQLEPQL